MPKIELLDGNILNAEQMLKDVINHEVALIQALKLYIEVRMSLKRSIKQTLTYLIRVIFTVSVNPLGADITAKYFPLATALAFHVNSYPVPASNQPL